VLPAGESIELRVGRGTNTANGQFWGQGRPVFENVVGGSQGVGDGAYLFDPQGDLRYWQIYPCSVGCDESLKGKVGFTVAAGSPESVHIANTSGGPIDLSEFEVESVPWFYEFQRGTVLQAGEAITLFVKRDPAMDTLFVKGWGLDSFLFTENRDVVTLRNPLGAPVLCAAWGGESCPTV
jgi:hypothetical protein